MKKRNQILALAMGFCLLESTQSFAATPMSQEQLTAALEKVTQQTVELQKEVKALKTELRDVKQQPTATKNKNKKKSNENADSTKAPPAHELNGGAPLAVMTGNLSKPDTDLDPSGLLSFQGSMNLDKNLLEKNQAADNLPAGDNSAANQSRVLMSGKLEVQGNYSDGYGRSSPTISGVDLTTAEIDTMARVSEDAFGFMAIQYTNAAENSVLNGSGNVVNNSNIYLNRGFLTIGNLNKTPFYLTAGQMYVPFGSYSSWILSNPLTKVLGRTNTRAIDIGFDGQQSGFSANAYVFDGAANYNNNGGSTLNNWGTSGGYKFKMGEYDAGLNIGFINDISSSQGIQQTSSATGSSFAGFSTNSATETLRHYVPGVDVNASISRGPLYFVAEGVGATRSYDPADMQFNGAGADPKAAHFEGGYNFTWLGKKSIFSLAYDHSWEGLPLGLPKESYIAAFNMSIWKNTVETLEFRHDINYPSSDTSGGQCANSSGGATACAVTPSVGGSQNSVIAQIGVYF